MQRFVSQEGIRVDQPVTFLSDGGDTVRQAQTGFGHMGEYVLDWFHIGMRFQTLTQLAKGLEETEDSPTREAILKDIDGAKWHVWHGSSYRSIERLESLTWDVAGMKAGEAKRKLAAKLEECLGYLDSHRAFIVDYGDRFRHGEPIATGFVESAVNQVVVKRFVKKQQMRWSDKNAHGLLQVRTAVLNEELRSHFLRWYPALAANDAKEKLAA
jgi:phage gp29-like protein